MPFPLAHPAAVLPLRRYCPRWFSFPALVIGSVTPDFGYFFGGGSVDVFSHRLLGSIVFCLPVGLVLLGLLYGLRSRAVGLLPADSQPAFRALCQRPAGSLGILVISLLLGTWTHLLWDSFTHTSGWFVQHLSLLDSPVFSLGGHTARVCHLLWYGCSFGGVVCVFLAFEKWKWAAMGGPARGPGKPKLRDAILPALLVVPIELLHHLVRNWLGLYLAAALCALLVAGFVLKAGSTRRPLPASEPEIQPRESE
jgi:hypothetical protein